MLRDYFPKFHLFFILSSNSGRSTLYILIALYLEMNLEVWMYPRTWTEVWHPLLPKIFYDFSKYCLQVLLSDKRSKPISWRLKESYSCIFSLPLTFIAIQGRLVASWVWGWYSLRLAAHAGKAFNRYVERKWKLCTHSTE